MYSFFLYTYLLKAKIIFYCFGEKLGIYYDLIFKHLAMIISMIMMLKIVMMFLFYVLLA